MGLSSKQVSCNGLQLDWEKTLLQVGALELPNPPQVKVRHQQQQQQQEPLNCPRCDSTNTKFCYYNNYNRSQPRHFCKTCRRHWTKGGTLRNVPVGGGRKNKRLKTAKTTTSTTINNQVNHHGRDTNIEIQSRQQFQHLPLALGDSKNISEMVYRALLHTPSSLPPSLHPDSSINSNNNSFLDSTLSLPLHSISEFPFTSSISFDNASSSVTAAFSPSEGYNYGGETETVVDPVITGSGITPQWQLPTSNNFFDSTSSWNWDDFATLVSTDLKQTWDEFEDKPNGK